jgi:hypothetical protein
MDVPPLYPCARRARKTKVCPHCDVEYPATRQYFHHDNHAPGQLASWCRTCRNAHQAEYAATRLERRHRQQQQARRCLRLAVLTHYSAGTPVWACCGEAHWEFLALDHINGGGWQQRRTLGLSSERMYRWIQKQGYPDGFRVLCHNCNMARGFYGTCPHEQERGAAC